LHLGEDSSAFLPFSVDVIDLRQEASGTNAATDIDNTTYTCESASAEGLLKIMTIFLF
jgi:Zn-dependent M16 (insulinase) family peptidase